MGVYANLPDPYHTPLSPNLQRCIMIEDCEEIKKD